MVRAAIDVQPVAEVLYPEDERVGTSADAWQENTGGTRSEQELSRMAHSTAHGLMDIDPPHRWESELLGQVSRTDRDDRHTDDGTVPIEGVAGFLLY